MVSSAGQKRDGNEHGQPIVPITATMEEAWEVVSKETQVRSQSTCMALLGSLGCIS